MKHVDAIIDELAPHEWAECAARLIDECVETEEHILNDGTPDDPLSSRRFIERMRATSNTIRTFYTTP